MKRLVLILFVLLSVNFVMAEKITEFPELKNPFYIMTDDTHLYITDGPIINIYSLKDYKLIKSFGREGEGPREFKINPRRSAGSIHIFIHDDYILANSIGKVSYFTKNGDYIKETPTKASPGLRFRPLGDKFVGEGFINENSVSYSVRNFYDSDFKMGKELYRRESFSQTEGDMNPFYMTSPIMNVYENKIYINDAKELKVLVFDSNGKPLPDITTQYEKLPVTEDIKTKILHWYKTYPGFKDLYELWKNRLKFPKYLPAIRTFDVVDQKVYVLTFKKEGDKSEFYIFDLKGNLLKKAMVFLAEKDERFSYPYTIKNNKIYQLIENEDEEEWELFMTPIN